MKKKIAAIGMTILIMLGVSGCMDRHEKNNEEMLAHMKEKYGVEFEIQDYIPRNVDCSYDVWFCNAVGDDPETDRIEVHRYYGELAKKHEYEDEYYSRLVRDEIESRATEAMLQISDEAKVFLSYFSWADEEYTKVEQLDEYLQTKSGNVAFSMLIFVVDHEDEGITNQEVVNKLEKELADAGIGFPRLRIFFVKDDELFQKIDRESHEEMTFGNAGERIYTCDYSGSCDLGFEKH